MDKHTCSLVAYLNVVNETSLALVLGSCCFNSSEPPVKFVGSNTAANLTYQKRHPSPEHRLMPVRLVSSCHVFARESSAHNGVIMVLHTSTAQSDVVETRSVSSLSTEKKMTVNDLCNHMTAWDPLM